MGWIRVEKTAGKELKLEAPKVVSVSSSYGGLFVEFSHLLFPSCFPIISHSQLFLTYFSKISSSYF